MKIVFLYKIIVCLYMYANSMWVWLMYRILEIMPRGQNVSGTGSNTRRVLYSYSVEPKWPVLIRRDLRSSEVKPKSSEDERRHPKGTGIFSTEKVNLTKVEAKETRRRTEVEPKSSYESYELNNGQAKARIVN